MYLVPQEYKCPKCSHTYLWSPDNKYIHRLKEPLCPICYKNWILANVPVGKETGRNEDDVRKSAYPRLLTYHTKFTTKVNFGDTVEGVTTANIQVENKQDHEQKIKETEKLDSFIKWIDDGRKNDKNIR
jgi:hypothetical protein